MSEIPRHWRMNLQMYTLTGEVCPKCDEKIFPPRDNCPTCNKHLGPFNKDPFFVELAVQKETDRLKTLDKIRNELALQSQNA